MTRGDSRFNKLSDLNDRQLRSFDEMVKSKQYTWEQIASRFNVSKQAAYQFAKERGLPPLGRG